MLLADAERLFALQDSNEYFFEKLIEACYRAELKPGDHAVDGGAHCAMHTKPMAECVGSAGRVYAFEPSPSVCPWLRELVKNYPSVVVEQKALSDREGTATFQNLPEEPWLSSLNVRECAVGKEVEEITVDLFRLDSLSDQPIRFMKLDLEGGELHALRGAKLLIRKQKPVIAFECGRIDAARTSGFASEEFFALFEQLGYDIYDLFGELFGPAQFQLPWNDRTVPHYTVAALSQRQDVFQRLRDEVASQLAKVN